MSGQLARRILATRLRPVFVGIAVALGSLFLAAVPPAMAQERISEIEVVGTQRIEPATVMSYMQVQPGDDFDVGLMDASLKDLFNTGLFADVSLRREGDRLIVQIVENPIINRIAFEGNKRLDDETLESEVSLRPRVVFTRTKVQSDVQRLLELYRRLGRFAATVDPKVIQLSQNRVDLVFEIDEGAATGIRRISFIGNTVFGDSTLRGVVQTVESAFYRILSTDDTYDPDRLTFDRELLRRFYLSEGYADFRVVSAVAELTQDQEDFIITFTVDEGQRYRFGEVDLESSLKDISVDDLKALVTSQAGDWYDADQVDETINTLSDAVGARGFAFVDVRPRVRRDRDALEISIVYEVNEGPRVYVERININGNIRTLDKVIRREFRLVEGDAFSTAKLAQSRRRLGNLGFFAKVDVETGTGTEDDRTIITVNVEEQSTGDLTLGAGFSTSAGLLSDISIRERNLLGRGQDLRLGFTLAQRQQQIDLSFTEPYFLDRDLSAGFDVFRRLTDLLKESSFEEDATGVGLRLGYQLTDQIRHNVRYGLERAEIANVKDTASRVIQSQEGSAVTSFVSNEFFYDALDTRVEPSDGFFVKYNVDVAGLGGSVRYLRNTVGAGVFVPFFEKSFVASLRGEVGQIVGLGEDVRLVDRFFLGGSNLRGFRNSGVGPRDIVTDDAIGGNLTTFGTAELQFPLGLPEELGLSARVFSDFGLLTNVDDSGSGIVDTGNIRASVGFGLSWRSPLGPARLDVSQAVLKEAHDKTETLRFSFGTRF